MSKELSKIPEINTITDIVVKSAELPKLREADNETVNKNVVQLILEVFNYYNESPNNVQANLIELDVRELFSALTIQDIQVFKKNCLSGKYPLKFRLTPIIFKEWINEYIAERLEAEHQVIESTIIQKREEELGEYSDKTIEFLKDLSAKLKEKEKQKPENKIETIPQIGYHKAIKDYQMYLSAKFDEIAIKDKEDERGNTIPPHLRSGKRYLLKMDWVKKKYTQTYNWISKRYKFAENISFEDFYTTELNKITQ